jgi:hypothetical protein
MTKLRSENLEPTAPPTSPLAEDGVRANRIGLPSLPNDRAKTGAGAKSMDSLVTWTNSLLINLSACGLTGLSREDNREALIEARIRLFADADDAWNEELPAGKSVGIPGYQAAVVRLSKRLADMAEAYFENFIGQLAQNVPSTIAGADQSMTEKWLLSVVQISTDGLWRDVNTVFANWLDQIRARTNGAVCDARPRSIDDPEYLILQSHNQRMSAALWRIAERYSIPRETIADAEASVPCAAARIVVEPMAQHRQRSGGVQGVQAAARNPAERMKRPSWRC